MRFAITLAACVFAASGAQAAILDFESFVAGQAVNSVTFSDGTTATVTTVSNRSAASGGTNQAGVFDTNNPTGNDTDLAGPFASGSGGPDLSPGNILIILGPDNGLGLPDDDMQGGSITFDFDRPVDLLSFNYFDTESTTNGLVVTSNNGDNSGVLFVGDNMYDTFTANFLGVTSLTFTLGGSGGIDGLEIAPIPVPASLPLFAAALVMFGVVSRRRRLI
jgi:hypothetical protein